MANIYRYRVTWSGFTGGPGISSFYYASAVDPSADLHTLFNGISAAFPSQVRWDFATELSILNDATGALVGTSSAAGAATVPGSGSNLYASQSGILVQWRTGAVVNGKKVQGKTFLVPADGAAYGSGQINTGLAATLQTAFNAYLGSTAGLAHAVWHRPKPPAVGSTHDVTSVHIPLEVVTLRSRRD